MLEQSRRKSCQEHSLSLSLALQLQWHAGRAAWCGASNIGSCIKRAVRTDVAHSVHVTSTAVKDSVDRREQIQKSFVVVEVLY